MERELSANQSSNNNFKKSKPFEDVLSGNFPEVEVKKMNIFSLRAFVLKLVKYTSAKAGATTLSMVNYKQPLWWPRDVLFDNDKLSTRNRDQRKQLRLTLRHLVLKCCEFFRKSEFHSKWPPKCRPWENDENFNTLKTRGLKRRGKNIAVENSVNKRKRLISKNESVLRQTCVKPCQAVIRLQDILVPPKQRPLNQQQFLNKFGLCHNNNYAPETPQVSQNSRYVKLYNCPHIPLSSDIGKAIIKRENCSIPEYVTTRKLERLEWYVNKEVTRKSEQTYEVSFVNNKVIDYHLYKFPKRQQHQLWHNVQYQSFLFSLCRPLSVVIESENLELKKKWYDSLKIEVSVSKLSSKQFSTYLHKNFKIVLKKKVQNKIVPRTGTRNLTKFS